MAGLRVKNEVEQPTKLDLNITLGKIRSWEVQRDKVIADFNEKVCKLRADVDKKLQGVDEEIKLLSDSVVLYCSKNKELVFTGETKTVKFRNGSVSYKSVPSSVVFRDEYKEDEVVELIQKSEKWKKELVRTHYSVNKTAVMDNFKDKQITIAELQKFGLTINDGDVIYSFKTAVEKVG